MIKSRISLRAVLSLSILGVTCVCKGQSAFENAYAARYMTEEGYYWITKGIEVWSAQPERCPGREALAASSFVRELGDTNRPALEKYAGEDVNQNPIAVLWAQLFLRLEGRDINISMPRNFRDLSFLARTIYRHLKNQDDRTVLSRQYVDRVRQLKRENFLQPYYDPSWDGEYEELWREDLPTHLLNLIGVDVDYVKGFLRELLLLESDLGAWYWDRDFARLIVTQYATNCFGGVDWRYQKIYIPNPGGGTTVTNEPRDYEEMTRLQASSMLRMHSFTNAKKLVPFYRDLSREMVERLFEKSLTITEGFWALAQNGLHHDMMTTALDKIEPSMGGALTWLSIPWHKTRSEDGEIRPLQISPITRREYEKLGIPDERPLSADEIERLREAVLSDKYCLNYYAITALLKAIKPKDESEYWEQWRNIAERQMHIRDYYEYAVNLLGQDRMCDSYKNGVDRFVELRNSFDAIRKASEASRSDIHY